MTIIRTVVPRFCTLAAVLLASWALLIGGCTMALGGSSTADFSYRGYRFTLSEVGNSDRQALMDAARQQVDIVEQVGLSAETTHFFQSFTIHLAEGSGGGGHFGRRGVSIDLRRGSDDRPILLHEFMHAFQNDRLPGGAHNPDVLRFFQHARTPGLWPPRAYMLKSVGEFFAMSASTYLYGHADRPPSTREELEKKQPRFAEWLAEHVH